MKRTAVLSACVLALAASTFYFARELHALRAGQPGSRSGIAISAAAQTVAPGPAPEETTSANLAGPDYAAALSPETTAPRAAATSPAAHAKQRRESAARAAREFLALHENPVTRKAFIEDQFLLAQRYFSLLQPRVELDEERWEKFLRLTVDFHVDRRVRVAHCWIDPKCEKPELPAGHRDRERQQMVDLIGEGNFKKFEDFLRERPQTGSLAKLQARLGPSLALPPDQLSELSRAISQEAARTRQELEGRGVRVATFEGSHGVIVFSEDTQTLDERMASASASVLRLRERAGALLDGERLRIFNQLLDDSLLKFRPHARTDVAIVAAGYER